MYSLTKLLFVTGVNPILVGTKVSSRLVLACFLGFSTRFSRSGSIVGSYLVWFMRFFVSWEEIFK